MHLLLLLLLLLLLKFVLKNTWKAQYFRATRLNARAIIDA